MLKKISVSLCLLISLSASAVFNNNNKRESHKENNRKNHDCGYTQRNVILKQATKDLAQHKKDNLLQIKNELHNITGPVSALLKNLENGLEFEDKN